MGEDLDRIVAIDDLYAPRRTRRIDEGALPGRGTDLG